MSVQAEQLHVRTLARTYPIFIGKELLTSAQLAAFLVSNVIVVVSDQNVAPLYLSRLQAALGERRIESFIIKPGEHNKSFEAWHLLMQFLIDIKLNRDATIIALGGGVVGDLAGFAASTFHRGINFIQIPTTLLAQVDASVGGKTAINFQHEKNAVGTFYQPTAVFADTSLLSTLPEREYRAGIAEVIKYALLENGEFYLWLEFAIEHVLAKEPAALAKVIKYCCQIKAGIIAQDETEHKNIRVLLNLGHTFAHTLERIGNYQRWLHGEAVAMGLYCQAMLSYKLGHLSNANVNRVKQLLVKAGLPYQIPTDVPLTEVMTLMYRDKKVKNAKLTLILTQDTGPAFSFELKDDSLILDALALARKSGRKQDAKA